MSLTRRVFLFVSFFLPSLLVFAEAPKISVSEQAVLAAEGRDLLLSRKYQEAEFFFKKMIAEKPEELMGYLGIMSLYQIRNLENFDFRFDAPYERWEKKGRQLAYQMTQNPNASSWDLLMAGGTLGVSGFYRAHNGRWLRALKDGVTGVHTLQKVITMDLGRVGRVDALFGVGLYDYWRSHFTRKLKFFPFFQDRREEGKRKLQRVTREGNLMPVLAEISLAFIDFKEKKFEPVLATTQRLLKTYPHNTIVRMLRGETLLSLERFSEAAAEFKKIMEADPTITRASREYEFCMDRVRK